MKTQYGTIIEPSGHTREVLPANGKKFTLEELQSFVSGFIEHVMLRPGNGRGQMYINEEGKFTGLVGNPEATKIAFIHPADFIVGNAVIVRSR